MSRDLIIVALTAMVIVGVIVVVVAIGLGGFSNRNQPWALRELTQADIDAWMTDVILNRAALATEDGRRSYILEIARQVQPPVEFNTSRATTCDQWLAYGQYYLDLAMGVLAGYNPPQDTSEEELLEWAEITMSEEDLRRLGAYTLAAVEMANRAYDCFILL